MAVNLKVKAYKTSNTTWTDISHNVISLSGFDIWLINYDWTMKKPTTTASFNYYTDSELTESGTLIKYIQNDKVIFYGYIESSDYIEDSFKYDVKINNIICKLDTPFIESIHESLVDAYGVEQAQPEGKATGIKLYNMFADSGANGNDTGFIGWMLNYFCGIKYNINYEILYAGIVREGIFNLGLSRVSGAEGYRDIDQIAEISKILDGITKTGSVISFNGDSENDIRLNFYIIDDPNTEYYPVPENDKIYSKSEKVFDYARKVAIPSHSDQQYSYALDSSPPYPLIETDKAYDIDSVQSMTTGSGKSTVSMEHTVNLHFPRIVPGGSPLIIEENNSLLRSQRFAGNIKFSKYLTDFCYDLHLEYYINISSAKAVFKNGIFLTELELFEGV